MTEDSVLGHLGVGTSFDRYAYAWDNPLNLYDLDGRDVCVPTPFGDACAGDAAEDVGSAAGNAAGAAGSAAESAWKWTQPGRQWVSERAQDLVKEINLSTEEFLANSASIIATYAFCATATAAATAVGTPAAGVAAVATCATADAVGYGGAALDIVDEDNSLWTEELYR